MFRAISSLSYRQLDVMVDRPFGIIYSQECTLLDTTVLEAAELFKRKFDEAFEQHPLRRFGSMTSCKRRRVE
jgi:hypothetical protein